MEYTNLEFYTTIRAFFISCLFGLIHIKKEFFYRLRTSNQTECHMFSISLPEPIVLGPDKDGVIFIFMEQTSLIFATSVCDKKQLSVANALDLAMPLHNIGWLSFRYL